MRTRTRARHSLILTSVLLLTAARAGALSDCLIERGRLQNANTGAAAVAGGVVASLQNGGWATRPMARFARVAGNGMVEVGRWHAVRHVLDVHIDAATALITADDALVAVDLRILTSPVELGSLPLPAARHLAVNGELAFVAGNGDDGAARLDIVTTTDPTDLSRIGGLVWTGPQPTVTAVAVDDGIVLIADNAGLRIVDVSDPSSPVELVRRSGRPIRDAVVVGRHAVAARVDPALSGSRVLEVLDIDDPSNPIVVGVWQSPSEILSVAEYGGAVLAGTSTDGLYHIGLDDPSQPTVIDRWRAPGFEISHLATAWPTIALSDALHGTEILGLARACVPPRQSNRKTAP